MVRGVKLTCSFYMNINCNICVNQHYLKYLTPDEYSHLRDHIKKTTLPLHVVLKKVNIALDESFVELHDDKPPVFSGLYLQFEEWTEVEIAMEASPSEQYS